MAELSPKRQLEGFIAKFTPEAVAATKTALAEMRKRLPGALEFVCDDYNALRSAGAERTHVGGGLLDRGLSAPGQPFFYYGPNSKIRIRF